MYVLYKYKVFNTIGQKLRRLEKLSFKFVIGVRSIVRPSVIPEHTTSTIHRAKNRNFFQCPWRFAVPKATQRESGFIIFTFKLNSTRKYLYLAETFLKKLSEQVAPFISFPLTTFTFFSDVM